MNRTVQTSTPVRGHTRDVSTPVTVVIGGTDSVESRRYKEEDEAAGYESIDNIKPGKGQEDVDMKEVNGMTDEEFLNRYSRVNYLRFVELQMQKPWQLTT